MKLLKTLAITVLMLTLTSLTWAATVTYTDSIDIKRTNWTDVLQITKFDPSLGTLNSISAVFNASIYGDMTFEGLDNAPQTFEYKQDGTMTFKYEGIVLDTLQYAYTATETLGNEETFTAPVASLQDSISLNGIVGNPYSSWFIGTGLWKMGVDAEGTSGFIAPANVASEVNQFAYANLKVTYDYTPKAPTPVPEGNILLGLIPAISGVIGSAEIRRRLPGMVKK